MGAEGKMAHHDGDLQFEEGALRSVTEVLRSARAIRVQLGEKHDLLDSYLKSVLTTIADSVMTTESARYGFESALMELRGLCRNIRQGNLENAKQHPFYPVAKAFIDEHDLPQDSAFYETCCVGMLPEFSVYAVRRFQEQNEAKLRSALLENGVAEAKAALGAEIGQPTADTLHDSVLRCFMAVPQTQIFMQAMLEQAVSSLLVNKPDTEDYIFKNIMNGGFF